MNKNTAAITRGTQPPLGILMQEDERKISSMDPKNRMNIRENTRLLCHTRLMISDIKQVVTNVTVRYAIPEINKAILAISKEIGRERERERDHTEFPFTMSHRGYDDKRMISYSNF